MIIINTCPPYKTILIGDLGSEELIGKRKTKEIKWSASDVWDRLVKQTSSAQSPS